jgi:hypothetical protein
MASKWKQEMLRRGELNKKGADLSPADQAKRITELETMLLGQLVEMTFINEGEGQELYHGTASFKSKNPDNGQPRTWPVYYTTSDLEIFNTPESFEAMLKLRVCNNLATHMVITIDWLQEVVNAS